uniref:Uncharacterized protein n=1 Tax=Rhizophora mucronata TaxID=61149 RepID=A0A2P2MIX6_RHIMU
MHLENRSKPTSLPEWAFGSPKTCKVN